MQRIYLRRFADFDSISCIYIQYNLATTKSDGKDIILVIQFVYIVLDYICYT
ncbi:MAG: hypothetical protein J6V61_03170 [Bacteroidaceae bacterium]|nr:hypothetical protein [Bacteroidaceae bacterium]